MNFARYRSACFLIAFMLTCLSFGFAQAPLVIQTNANIMLDALESGVYASFVSSGSEEFKSTYVRESFEAVREVNAARLTQGYDATFLTSLNTQGYVVYLWKLSFADGGDDGLLSLSVQNGFVVGFLIQ